ncbi:unnamed protein product [Cylicocyclus nassatus]|uniref:Serine/threonine-protein phosphatase PGAM5, mitochondrial n=1 Tax=Cylicocyclus nassatus TaxID=53992 RepID=A0AA36HAZ9_CYLNA|nr:unnamed protein product [Cylicocyclus nassatus]
MFVPCSGCQHRKKYPARDSFLCNVEILIRAVSLTCSLYMPNGGVRLHLFIDCFVTYVTLGLRFAEIRTGADACFCTGRVAELCCPASHTFDEIWLLQSRETAAKNAMGVCTPTRFAEHENLIETLIVLCLADGINGFSIFLMGFNRVLLYSEVIDTLTIPVRTSWECAVEPWLFFRGYGDLWPPIVQFAMGIDRCAAVFNPIVYNKRAFKRRGNFFGATLLCVSCVLAVGYGISWSMRSLKVKYWCGRKAAFGDTFASFVYGMNIVCYVIAFLLSLISYIKSKYWLNTSSAKQQLARIRYQLMISVLSIVLISTPNTMSLLSQYITKVADAISKPSTYLICVKASDPRFFSGDRTISVRRGRGSKKFSDKGFQMVSLRNALKGAACVAGFAILARKLQDENAFRKVHSFTAAEPKNFDEHFPRGTWDDNWDFRSPAFLLNKKKYDKASDEDKKKMEEEVKVTATRNIFLIRHGQYELDKENKCLTPLGREQAAFLGKRLAECGIPFDQLVMSTMTRAKETAEIILEHLPPTLKRSSCSLLEEGPPYPPVPAVDHWKPQHAEFFAEGSRIESAFRRHIHRAAPWQKEDSYELYVCHANVIRYFVCRALQFPPEGWLRMSLGNCSITWLVIRPSGRVSQSFC